MPGPQKAQRDKEDYEARKEHSNSGSNTHRGTGMDYMGRKNAHRGNDVQRRREDGNRATGNHKSVAAPHTEEDVEAPYTKQETYYSSKQ
ncbi:hypothetical protein G6514_009278 [Epicoccum nigrum]|nr:hypothetical protein G6514_009278 [Epicoccum nigrum]